MSKTVFVGLSGGVDSAVSAALLKNKGFNVVGVFIKIWQPEFLECTWSEDRIDAMRVAVALGIPFREIDLSEDYKRSVVEEMVSGYARGITPNPDVLCNRHIKFGSFWEYAKKEGSDFIATGHYARIREGKRPACAENSAGRQKAKGPPAPSLRRAGKSLELLRGSEKNKDQSYFLYTLEQDDLARSIFPVGDLTKNEVRVLARRARLPVAQKPDSQGLCFVGDVTMKNFLSRYITLESGPVLDREGTTIGTHDGAALYTIGQRHGFTAEHAVGDTVPHYVIAVDVSSNTIRVSPRREDATRKEVSVSAMHWIGEVPALPQKAHTQTRYREEPHGATITREGGGVKVIFDEPRIAATGQSLVVYHGDTCLGGGAITN